MLNGEKKRYAWCACGKSEKQPFCDGSHKGTDFSPIIMDNEKECNKCSMDNFCLSFKIGI